MIIHHNWIYELHVNSYYPLNHWPSELLTLADMNLENWTNQAYVNLNQSKAFSAWHRLAPDVA